MGKEIHWAYKALEDWPPPVFENKIEEASAEAVCRKEYSDEFCTKESPIRNAFMALAKDKLISTTCEYRPDSRFICNAIYKNVEAQRVEENGMDGVTQGIGYALALGGAISGQFYVAVAGAGLAMLMLTASCGGTGEPVEDLPQADVYFEVEEEPDTGIETHVDLGEVPPDAEPEAEEDIFGAEEVSMPEAEEEIAEIAGPDLEEAFEIEEEIKDLIEDDQIDVLPEEEQFEAMLEEEQLEDLPKEGPDIADAATPLPDYGIPDGAEETWQSAFDSLGLCLNEPVSCDTPAKSACLYITGINGSKPDTLAFVDPQIGEELAVKIAGGPFNKKEEEYIFSLVDNGNLLGNGYFEFATWMSENILIAADYISETVNLSSSVPGKNIDYSLCEYIYDYPCPGGNICEQE